MYKKPVFPSGRKNLKLNIDRNRKPRSSNSFSELSISKIVKALNRRIKNLEKENIDILRNMDAMEEFFLNIFKKD